MTLIGAATRRLYGPRALIRPRQSLPLRQDLTDFTPYTPFTARLLHESSSAPEAPKTDNTVKPPSHSVGRQDAVQLPDNKHALDEFKRFFRPLRPTSVRDIAVGKRVTVTGFLSRRRAKHSKLVFADLTSRAGVPLVQMTSTFEDEESPASRVNKTLRAIPLHSPIMIRGTVTKITTKDSNTLGPQIERLDLELDTIEALNPFPKDIIVSEGVRFPPTSRHLQMRFSQALYHRLLFRDHVSLWLRRTLQAYWFMEVETPVLFKSTPEGAREFIVPTRRKGLAYALSQSPQQYKQLLMAGGVMRYYQFARCFRDEDLRADRQPEFTQLDLEMAFATGANVMKAVESIMIKLCRHLTLNYRIENYDGELVTVHQDKASAAASPFWPFKKNGESFPHITYEEAMSKHGSDKPDLRIPFQIRRIDSILPQSFVSMISPLQSPAVDAIKIRLKNTSTDVTSDKIKVSQSFISTFMDNLPPQLARNPDGAPAVLLVDSSKPLNGLSSLGHEAIANLTSGTPSLEAFSDLTDGDILIIQAREDKPFHSGSTALGNLRSLLYHEAVAKGLLFNDTSLRFAWVTAFPMFTPDADKGGDPGQGGQAGFSATHHPFTAPLTDGDFDLMMTDPLRAKADHYDLVCNGVELGGGSRRIHVAEVQEYVMRDILRMTDDGVAQFAHLLEALRAGCPPHAGFALGFDRLIAVLSGTNSVRDVIAFPKSMKGEDMMVKSPSRLTEEQLDTYHLRLKE